MSEVKYFCYCCGKELDYWMKHEASIVANTIDVCTECYSKLNSALDLALENFCYSMKRYKAEPNEVE